MKNTIMDIIVIATCVVMVTIACIVAHHICNNDTVYVTKYKNTETGVNYLITNDSIIEMHNPDGTLYTE